MAGGDSKGGSDLDVFEGLGKKNSTRAPTSAPRASAPPPPPPPSLRRPDPQKQALAQPAAAPHPPPSSGNPHTATLPSAKSAPSPSSSPAAPSSKPSRSAPPPPVRAALPPVVPPPSKSSVTAPPALSAKPLAAPPPAAAAPARKASGMDMDWDEEEEATHVLDRDGQPAANGVAGPPGATRPAPAPTAKQTLVGLSGGLPPPPPPSARPPSLPPPPPSASTPYARPSAPPPGARQPSAPPPASMRAAAPPPAAPPPPLAPPPAVAPPSLQNQANGSAAAGNFPYQPNTTPMAMPARAAAARPAQSAGFDEAPLIPTYSRSRMEATALVRPQQRPTGLMIAAGAGVVVLLAFILFLMPHSGQLAVNVSDTKGGAVRNLQISVDGKLQCDSAPCLVHSLSAGSHTVKVEATGYEPPADKAVAVESGKDTTLDFKLTPTSAPSSGGTGVKVAGSQPGEKLYIDDREIGTLPQELRDLTPGVHKIRVSAGDQYAAVERSVTLAKDEFQDLGTVTLKVVKGRATVSLATPGAKVFLVSGSDRRELPTLPMSIDLDPAKQWSLVATKAGYADYTKPLSFDDGQAEKSFLVSLDPKTATASVGGMSFSPPPQTYSPPPPRPSPPREPREPREPKESASGGGGEGTLNMNSIPSSSVVLDGKPIGSTPQIGVTVSAGTHTVVFVNAEQGFKKSVSVTVAAGETKKVHP